MHDHLTPLQNQKTVSVTRQLLPFDSTRQITPTQLVHHNICVLVQEAERKASGQDVSGYSNFASRPVMDRSDDMDHKPLFPCRRFWVMAWPPGSTAGSMWNRLVRDTMPKTVAKTTSHDDR